jgi:hypothetical protein
VVSVHPSKKDEFEAMFSDAKALGTVGGNKLKINSVVDLPVADLTSAYHSTFSNY